MLLGHECYILICIEGHQVRGEGCHFAFTNLQVLLHHLELNILCLTMFICFVSITKATEGRRASMVAQW